MRHSIATRLRGARHSIGTDLRGVLVALAVSWCAAVPALAQPGMQLVTEGLAHLEQGEYEPARQCFEQAIERGRSEGDALLEGGGHRGLGKLFTRKADYRSAREALDRALPLVRQAGDHASIANVLTDLGYVAWATGNAEQAVPLYREALTHFEAAGDAGKQASTLYNLAFTMRPGDEQLAILQQGLAQARLLGDRRLEGLFLHRWGDQHFTDGDVAEAAETLDRAAALLAGVGAKAELARVYTSMGRLQRFHGQPDKAVEFYRQALGLQQGLDDIRGVIQSIDAMAIAYHNKGDWPNARTNYEKALELARGTKAPTLVSRQLAHLAAIHVDTGEFQRAVDLLDEATRLDPQSSSHYQQLTAALFGLGRYDEALAAADKAVGATTQRVANPEVLAQARYHRARALAALGRSAEAIAEARESVQAIERLRRTLIASEETRREFTAQHQARFDFLIGLLYDSGAVDEALELAEQGRARGFLDLLATRSIRPSKTADAELQALVSAPPFTLAQVGAAAERLQSTLLAYWVGPKSTYAWTVSPGRPVRAVRLDVGRGRLEKLIPTGPGNRSKKPALRTRGGDALALDALPPASWRRLYDLLIRPVREWLPAAAGARVTVIPHGPLFRLSFAALQNERGEYLLERYALHYVPSAAILDFTAKTKERAAGGPSRYLLVADPRALPPSPDGTPLPRLPGTRIEVDAIARRAPAGSVTMLTGERASEEALRAQVPGKTIIHLATHGIVRDDQPLESFLALAGKARLTVRKIYGLDLAADLVVLSACRTGLGSLSGDGVIGLTRAFFYAGTPSVVATLWDVADEPTYRLVSGFYDGLARHDDKARALRNAQLRVLRALRRGEVKVRTPFGPVNLPENPIFWAGFVLQGEI